MNHWLSLTKLLHEGRQPQYPIAFKDNGDLICWQEFYVRVCYWHELCQQHPHIHIWALYLEDSVDFSAALLALWQLRKCACIPGDNLPGTVHLLAEHVGGFLGNFDNLPDEIRELPHLAPNIPIAAPANVLEFTALDREQLAVMVFTSGTTGKPKGVSVFLRQLDDEVKMHEQLWGSKLHQATVASTVSHQHLYGLLHKLLWPICAGRPFIQSSCDYLEQLANHAQQHKTLAVITTPSHLSRIPPAVDWHALKDRWAAVISSTAPLNLADSETAKAAFGTPITEIFGSSETGGIAWRQQTENEHWQVLPGIKIAQDQNSGALEILSPLLPDNTWLQTSDRIDLISSSSFRMLGRMDRIVKIEGKRVSLSAIEQQLEQHPLIEQCRAIELHKRTAIAASLTAEGKAFLHAHSKPVLNQQLRSYLKDHFETPVLPRRWRYPAELPRNAQGKITQHALELLFSDALTSDNASNNGHMP